MRLHKSIFGKSLLKMIIHIYEHNSDLKIQDY